MRDAPLSPIPMLLSVDAPRAPPTPTSMLGCLMVGVYFAAIRTPKTKRREHVLRRLFRWNDFGKTPTLFWGEGGPAKQLSFEMGVFFADTGTPKKRKKKRKKNESAVRQNGNNLASNMP